MERSPSASLLNEKEGFMHFRLPAPLHGWRAFVGEVGIIVLGVLLALGAEQLIQSIHGRTAVAQMRGALRAELADDRARWEDMRDSDRCTARRLDAIAQWLSTAPANGRLPRAFPIMLWNMHSSAWDIAKASQAADDLPLEERLVYSELYASIDNWRDLLAEERSNALELGAALATADQPENRRQIASHIYTAQTLLQRRQRNYVYFFTRFDKLHIRPDHSQLTIDHDPLAMCRPFVGQPVNLPQAIPSKPA
jgi:hypothetical protein